MEKENTSQQDAALLGSVEPHAPMLTVPSDDHLLYKIMKVENLLRSISGSYLHFNRVDAYDDDPNDGRQVLLDQPGNADTRFLKRPDFSAENYYDQSRARTYACCFSIENSNHIWRNYANGSKHGKACVVFNFGRLRSTLNQMLQTENSALEYNGVRCRQIFSINYGIVEYVDWKNYRANAERLTNPIKYTYLKDEKLFGKEKELRISLAACGLGQFCLNDGTQMEFPPNLQMYFNFKVAIADGTIEKVILAPDAKFDLLRDEMSNLGILPKVVD